QRLGFKWLRDMSPAELSRWGGSTGVEQSEGVFTYRPDAIANLPGVYNFAVLSTLGVVYPSFAGTPPDLTKWRSYVAATVKHWSPRIGYWEIGNEPLSCCSITANYYAQMLKTAVDAIKAVDSNAKIVCMGGLSDTGINGVLGALSSL